MDDDLRLLHRHKPPRPQRDPRRHVVELARDRVGKAVEGDRSRLACVGVGGINPLAAGDRVGDVGAAEGRAVGHRISGLVLCYSIGLGLSR